MGEWSDYFEDFPEENPANWINGQCNPQAASQKRADEERKRVNLAHEQASLDAEIKTIIEKHKQK